MNRQLTTTIALTIAIVLVLAATFTVYVRSLIWEPEHDAKRVAFVPTHEHTIIWEPESDFNDFVVPQSDEDADAHQEFVSERLYPNEDGCACSPVALEGHI